MDYTLRLDCEVMSSLYTIIKYSHMTMAVLSISGFVLRFICKQWQPHLLERKLVRVLPHIIDTLLLIFAIWLSIIISQYPFTHSWLTAKVIGLLVYIVLGTMALKRCSTKPGQIVSFIAALVVFSWIASVALSHQAIGFL